MNAILTKRESTDGYQSGRFGNHLRQWSSPDAVKSDLGFYPGIKFMIRWRGKGSGGMAKACNGWFDMANWWAHPLIQGDPNDYYVSERAPDDKLIFQGEIAECPHVGGYALHYSTEKLVQRDALKLPSSRHHLGPGAKLLCREFMDDDSYDDLLTLFDLYPLHTVEFSCFSIRTGNLHRNTIFWEARKF